ncbi:precorrin-3B synthase [Rhizobiales bacterium RZME27]|jgi:precorrin-3B synthase|uniref:Precorrin-3B synthase n=1 Tax=Endobacterium cereale TaxID=2663029 RepID=A0A6A8A9W3_9HYPH|nr:precorrin-3B synthase [Endobacterium cereale]MEB2847519.1 precorrin-3B synthase [Endobacterium cereale]MQY48022.1 precorrin-3B synthase [Endobacterium cereale]
MTATVLHPARTTSQMVRGACPALSTPMMTGDGLLARIGLDAPIAPADLARIGELATRHGNGLIDISARGNFQVRGLTAASARALETDILRMNLPLRDGLPVETGALAGLDSHEIADPEPLSSSIRAFVSEHDLSRRLAAKFAVVVDGGGQLPLHGLLADIRLLAVRREESLFWQVFLGGTMATGRGLGLVTDMDARTCVTLILARIAVMDVPLRGRELDPAEVKNWLAPITLENAVSHAVTRPLPYGLLALADIRKAAARIGIPFGQCRAETLIDLGQQAATVGITGIRPAIDHSLVVFGREDACQQIMDHSRPLILSHNDPRAKISACPGKPACRSASLHTHALGEIAARQAESLLDGSLTLHLSGCTKGCAHPSKALLNLVGMNDGTALIFDGKTSDMPLKLIRHGEEAKALGALDELVRLERGIGETTAKCLTRLGPARLEQALSQGLS